MNQAIGRLAAPKSSKRLPSVHVGMTKAICLLFCRMLAASRNEKGQCRMTSVNRPGDREGGADPCWIANKFMFCACLRQSEEPAGIASRFRTPSPSGHQTAREVWP